MKRRTIPKGEHGQQSRQGYSLGSRFPSKSVQVLSKKVSNKRPARESSSILALNKVETTSEKISAVEDVVECQRLREQLERVLTDHKRQEEEIGALRTLARSLKEEVETIQARQQFQSSASDSDNTAYANSRVSRLRSREFFKMDVQVEELQGENTELRLQLEIAQEELKSAHAFIEQKFPVYKLAAVKANAELRCVQSQLQQERAHSDSLQKQLVRCKARQDDVAVRVSPERGNNQEEHEIDMKESEAIGREREIFLQQCGRLQDDETSTYKKKSRTTSNGREDNAIEKQTLGMDFASPSKEPDDAVKADKLIHEDLLGLDFYLDELNL